VIKEHLEAIDRGLEPAPLPGTGPRVPRVVPSADGFPAAATFGREGTDLRLSREELAEAAEIEPELLDVVESYGLVTRRAGSAHYDGDALVVAKAVAELAAFGRAPPPRPPPPPPPPPPPGLVEAVLAPLVKQRNPEGRARADEVARELGALSVRLHAALVKAALRAYLGH
jgi:hypothetical protein